MAPSPPPDSYCWVIVRGVACGSMRIGRGFFSSGSSRCSSMESKPFQDAMKGYHDHVVKGRREIYQLEN